MDLSKLNLDAFLSELSTDQLRKVKEQTEERLEYIKKLIKLKGGSI